MTYAFGLAFAVLIALAAAAIYRITTSAHDTCGMLTKRAEERQSADASDRK